jgi:hypothetical protein
MVQRQLLLQKIDIEYKLLVPNGATETTTTNVLIGVLDALLIAGVDFCDIGATD